MPRIFDNISEQLQTALIQTLNTAQRADFCVGYFNLRGWRLLQPHIEDWQGDETQRVRLLIGMHRSPQEEIRELFSLTGKGDGLIDNARLVRLKRQIVEEFRQQLMLGAPTNADEQGLRDLARQMREGKLVVKLFLRYPLHAKLYLLHQPHLYSAPIHAYLGSSNLTFSGLSGQGELNTEVTDTDAAAKLAHWFEERWADRGCLDITADLIQVIAESWAREKTLSPYEVYLKMAYHLAQEALAGLSGEFKLPNELTAILFDYQAAAVQIAAHHLNKRGGVLLGDVVGLGKTLMATALARIFQDDYGYETLILCPKNLESMWRKYIADYRLIAHVLPTSKALRQLPELRRYRLIIIDESHNLRNREGQRYGVIRDYIEANESKVILLSATPYNKSYLDLSAQLRLFIPEDRDIGIRPERYIGEIGELEFTRRHQANTRSLAAFEKSEHADDWRDLMRLYLVRRTRSFIIQNYAETDPISRRSFLRLRDGRLSYFPARVPKTIAFPANDQFSRMYSDDVVTWINLLSLPRYGLGQYVSEKAAKGADADEKRLLENLSRAGERLMGFSRTNLFKRLESSGASFLQSIDRHILRNSVYLYAIENDLPLPIGTLDADAIDPSAEDEDEDSILTAEDVDENGADAAQVEQGDTTRSAYQRRAQTAYELFSGGYKRRFKWLRPTLFSAALKTKLREDSDQLLEVLRLCGTWDAASDTKLNALHDLIARQHAGEKVLIFSQFADTVRYLEEQLAARGVRGLSAVTGSSDDPTAPAWRFSPVSSGANVAPEDELRVLIATDVLSEGQNLQDAAIVINYDLPWAIIRLSQRAGRVDRIGQQAERILCYSFLPADGVEQIIRLRARVRQRLAENSEVVGSDEQFFDDDQLAAQLRDLYTEKSGILDFEADTEVDLASYAYQIWANATRTDPALAKKIADLPDVVYSTRRYVGSVQRPQGVLTYMKTADGTDSLAWLDADGNSVTQSQYAILRAAECPPDTPALERHPNHHDLVLQAVALMRRGDYNVGGQLGGRTSARRRAYERLKDYIERLKQEAPLFVTQDLERAVDDLYRYPLRSTARDSINRQIKAGVSNEDLAKLVVALRAEDRLSLIQEDGEANEPCVLCSLGLFDL
ncbi:MAG: phospholipase D-like domain-containing protein [Anaerolineae bacterium]|nr:phospholipase D-like domain-containing protein [Anaerolineae bacterium]NUQ05382.1 NgoFVII family restriction endonuclease [Anaerolineae bacterium]